MKFSAPQRQAVLGIALVAVLAATAVSGDPRVDDGVVRPALRESAEPDRKSGEIRRPSLDPASIVRLPEEPPAADLFAAKSWLPPPPPPAPATNLPPPAPTAPPLPFRYVGQMTGGDGQTAIYLAQGDEVLIVRVGEQVAGQYRVDGLDESKVTITYLPLNQQQMLVIPPR